MEASGQPVVTGVSQPDSVSQVGKAKEHIDSQTWQLRSIFEIAKILAMHHDLTTMLPQFLSRLIEMLDAAETGVLLIHNASEDLLVVRGSYGYDHSIVSEVRIAPGEAMGGRVFQTGKAEIYSNREAVIQSRANLTPTNRALIDRANEKLGQPHCVICIPLITGQSKIGVLILENRLQDCCFTNRDLIFLQYVADLIALAVENAHLREKLQEAQALYEANRLKAELISTLAHEMRTPLTSIKGYSTALLMEEATFSPETEAEFLQIIDEECDALQDLIHDLLESSIIDAGLLRLEPQPVIIPRLAQTVIDGLAHRASGQRFLVDFPESFPIVDADPRRIEQVLRNLLDNAVKYSAGGLVVVRGEIVPNEVIISVADQGVGIAPEHLVRLFEKGFRIKSGLGRHVVGSGLGLPIARTIVESHGGRIWAESQVGQGTTLYFTLPLAGTPSDTHEAQGAAA
jgi:signal transduction histidine kinase